MKLQICDQTKLKVEDIHEKLDELATVVNKTNDENIQKEQNTDSEISNLNEKVNHLEVVSKMFRVDSCATLARNGIQTSGYYDVMLGNSQSPVTAYCKLPEGISCVRLFFN